MIFLMISSLKPYCWGQRHLSKSNLTNLPSIKQISEELKEIYGDTYDYSKVNYIRNNIKVIITCKKHNNEFEKMPILLLKRNGCLKCSKEKRLKYLGNCDSVMSYAWIRPDGRCMSCKNLENFGFVFEKELDDHYSNTRMNCKYCGTGCQCKARLYLKRKEDA